LPDDAGRRAAERVLSLVHGLTADDLVICLLSGGGSALLAVPAPGLSLDDKRQVTETLLRSGATISEINAVRKHLSAVKGGRLALAAQPARILTLAISDVPGDDPSTIASGPTTGDPTTVADAWAILTKYGIQPPPSVTRRLDLAEAETPKPGDPGLSGSTYQEIANARIALDAAAEAARSAGIKALILGDDIEGEARHLGEAHAGMARHVDLAGEPITAPAVLLSGGETTVTVRGNGHGGRNTEYLLALAIALGGAAGIYALAADTDGIDGTEDNAGAFITPSILERARRLDLDPEGYLARNDSCSFFAALGDLLVTGPTLTNVNDFRAILIDR
jgi:glycerate 2-kinase